MTELALKMAGAVSFIAAAFFYGRLMTWEMKRKIGQLSAFLSLVTFIGENIEHFLKPIPDILSEYRGDYLTKSGFVGEAAEMGLHEAWKRYSPSLPGEADLLLDSYFASVGAGYAEEEKRLSDYTEKRLARILEKERESAADREKIYKTVPVMLAASVVLIIF